MSAEITTWLVPLVAMLAAGLLAGFAAGIFGIGGGFVVVPALLVVLPLLALLQRPWNRQITEMDCLLQNT